MRPHIVLPIMVALALALQGASRAEAGPSTTVLVDAFVPQPIPGDQFWFYNRVGGTRGEITGPGGGEVQWGEGIVTATITGGTSTWMGVWTSLNHPVAENVPLDFSAIFPPQVVPDYQGHVTGLRFRVVDGQGTFQAEVQAPDLSFPWRESVALSGGEQEIQFALPTLGEIRNLNWLVVGGSGDSVVVDRVELIVELPALPIEERAFLWSYAMLLSNWDSASGLTRDRSNSPAGDFDNVSASGMQAAAAVVAWHLGFITEPAATEIVTDTAAALTALPVCHGLWPHFVKEGQIAPDTEWSSVDTVVAIVALLEAQEALGLGTTEAEQVLTNIDWAELLLPDGSISHGFEYDPSDPFCGERLDAGWMDFGTESWLANFGYAAATGEVAEFDHSPPTFNGSGFVDELAWLLVPPVKRDRWGTKWGTYRQQAADRQLAYYRDDYPHHPCHEPPELFGLSAAEVPDPSSVDPSEIYQAFGVGGEIAPHDGSGVPGLGHAVVVPHYAGLVASLRPDEASAFWDWIEETGLLTSPHLFTPLNNVESFMFVDEPACQEVVWNALKGSWNLSLQTLGWGRLLAGSDNPLYRGMFANTLLGRGYGSMTGGVGGVAELPDAEGSQLGRPGSSGVEYGLVARVAAAVAAGVVALGGVAGYSRRLRRKR